MAVAHAKPSLADEEREAMRDFPAANPEVRASQSK